LVNKRIGEEENRWKAESLLVNEGIGEEENR